MIKTFIHPDLLLTVKQNIFFSQEEKLDSSKYEEAKNQGRNFANDILNQLFNKLSMVKLKAILIQND